MNVLVVDDNPEVLNLFCTGLSLAGFLVTVAQSGVAALSMAREQDAIVTDIDMPGMTGVELIERIRATRGETLPIIIVTGLCTAEVRDTATTHSCAVLDKPCDPMTLVATLRTLLGI
jgi:DNA-binding response OmpR family regulator